MDTDANVPLGYPLPRTCPLDPPPMLANLRRDRPVTRVTLWSGRQAWLVTRFDDVRQALRDSRLSSDASDPGFPSINPSQVIPNYRGGLARIDEARHRQIRRMVANKFTVRAAARWHTTVEQIADAQLDELMRSGRPADLLAGFALPMAVRTVCAVFGVPDEDMAFVTGHGGLVVARDVDPAQPAIQAVRVFVDDLVRQKERAPGTDVISQVVREQRWSDRISHDELVDTTLILLVAGHTTTSTTIALGTLSLLEQPDRFAALCADPALVDHAVEELLRYHTVVADGAPRVAKADLTIGDAEIRVGDSVVISLASANRDEEVFDRPDEFDLRRDARRHLGFGFGVHRCLGQHLARMELTVALRALARRLPTLRLAVPLEQVRFREDKMQYGLYELPVTW